MKRIKILRRVLTGLLTCLTFSGAAMADIHVSPDIPPVVVPTGDFDDPAALLADVGVKGYHLSEIGDSNIFLITDGNYQALAVVTRKGVILIDAPEPLPFFGPMPVLAALDEIATLKGIAGLAVTDIIYSHAHTDHIGGAGLVAAAYPQAKIWGHEKTARLLAIAGDPKRPVPTHTFKRSKKLRIGGKRLELLYFGNTHVAGNTFIYFPDDKVLMVVDVIFPGWVPFRRLALSDDIAGWIAGHDAVMSIDFDTLVAGHLTRLGNKHDVEVQIEYVNDIVTSIEAIINDASRLFAAADAIDNQYFPFFSFSAAAKWALFSGFFDASTMHCADILDAKYIAGPAALAGAETFNFSNCEAYLAARRVGSVNLGVALH